MRLSLQSIFASSQKSIKCDYMLQNLLKIKTGPFYSCTETTRIRSSSYLALLQNCDPQTSYTLFFHFTQKKGENAPNSVAKGNLVTLLYPYFYVNLRGIIVVKPANGKTPLKIVEQSFTDKIWVCACMFKFLRF